MQLKSMLGKNILATLGGLVTTNKEQEGADSGNCFVITYNPTSLAGSATASIVISVPDGIEMNILDIITNITNAWTYSFKKMGGTYSIGTELDPFCLNQGKNVKTARVKYSLSYTGSPTLTTLFSRSYPERTGDEIDILTGEYEKVIVPAGDYIASFTNDGANAASYPYMKSKFYEEEV